MVEVGDAPHHPLDLLDRLHQMQACVAPRHAAGVVPGPGGGDHTIARPLLRALATERPVGCIPGAAHADPLAPWLGTMINPGPPGRRAVAEGRMAPRRRLQSGWRGTRSSAEDSAVGSDVGMRLSMMEDAEAMGRAQGITAARRVVGEGPTDSSFAIDGLEPIDAIGPGAPAPGGR